MKAERVLVSERPARSEGNKKTSTLAKSKMKASTNPAENRSAGWPHPPLCGEVGKRLKTLVIFEEAPQRDVPLSTINYYLSTTFPDERNQTDILTPDFKPHSRLPA